MPKYIVTWSCAGITTLEVEVPEGATDDEITEASLSVDAKLVKERLDFDDVLQIERIADDCPAAPDASPSVKFGPQPTPDDYRIWKGTVKEFFDHAASMPVADDIEDIIDDMHTFYEVEHAKLAAPAASAPVPQPIASTRCDVCEREFDNDDLYPIPNSPDPDLVYCWDCMGG